MKHISISFACAAFFLFGIISGCGGRKTTSLVNTLTFDADDFNSIRLDYDADDIYVLESNQTKVVLKEYMNENNGSYYAKTSTKNGELLITEGKRTRSSSFESYIEICIPNNNNKNLSLHSTSGTIRSEIVLVVPGDFSVDTTSGSVEISNVNASAIKAASTNGSLSFKNIDAEKIDVQTSNAATLMNEINGTILYQSKGGKLTASQLSGSGSFHASGEGSLDISYVDVTGDISAYSKNGTLTVILPDSLAFQFSAVTRQGSINTSFSEQLAFTDHTALGYIGAIPDKTITLETRNGDIKVSRGSYEKK
ncbi:DUF4097 family beta strand repeat-containing protein [Lacrimispora sp.]|uniref:DUF4097 family beta strand repeat-containing protein n=1 Tax=Lacrimispora sp. TaxID=2719234 RepID=UPI0032E43751